MIHQLRSANIGPRYVLHKILERSRDGLEDEPASPAPESNGKAPRGRKTAPSK